jgi:hypothetical protein
MIRWRDRYFLSVERQTVSEEFHSEDTNYNIDQIGN